MDSVWPRQMKPPGARHVVKVLGCQPPGCVIEVDQHVAAEDDIEDAMLAGLGRIDEIDRA